jgi:hypothetical protein
MIYASIAAFAFAAIFGLTVLIKWFGNTDAPRAIVYTHGILAATGLVLLLILAINDKTQAPMACVVLFLIAALAGFYMFFRDIVKKKRTLYLGILHGLIALTSFIILLFFVINQHK